MEILPIIGIGLLAVVMNNVLKQYKPEFTIYLSLLVGVLLLLFLLPKIEGIVQLLETLAEKASIHRPFLVLLLKITGITILTEFAVSICKDAGENAIANKVELGGKVIIIALSIPILSNLLELLLKILP